MLDQKWEESGCVGLERAKLVEWGNPDVAFDRAFLEAPGGDRKIKYVMGLGKSWSIGLVHRIPDAGRWGSPGTWFVEKGVVWK